VDGVTAWSHDGFENYTGCFNACAAVSKYCSGAHEWPSGGWKLTLDSWPVDKRLVLVEDGVLVEKPASVSWQTGETTMCKNTRWNPLGPDPCSSKVHLKFEYKADAPNAITQWPYVRRDRVWVAVPWSSEEGLVVSTTKSDRWITTTRTTGSSETQIESFSWSLGGSVTATLKACSATIEASISKTFSRQVTVSESKEESISEHLVATPGKLTKYMLWVLVDRYSFVHEDGTLFTDECYEFNPGLYDPTLDSYYQFEIKGKESRVKDYVFDQETGELLSSGERALK
jgi:hypothetical protein